MPWSIRELHMNDGRPAERYSHIVYRQFRRNRIAVLGVVVIIGFFSVAVLADFLANDKPLLMRYQGRLYSPVLKAFMVETGLSNWPLEFRNISFKEFVADKFKDGDWAKFPPIRYSPTDVDLDAVLRRPSRLHFLGTDE